MEAKFSSLIDEKEPGALEEQMASRFGYFLVSSQLPSSGRSGRPPRFPVSVEQDLDLNLRRESLSFHLPSPPESEYEENSVGGVDFDPPIHIAQSAEEYFDSRHPFVGNFHRSSTISNLE